MTMDRLDQLLGVWAFVPSASNARELPLPVRGVYTLLADELGLYAHMRFTASDGTVHEHTGRPTPRQLNGHTLSRTGDVLTIEQQIPQGKQDPLFLRSVYRRSDAKQVLVYRRDLKMRKGKIAAQCAHASMAVFMRHDHGVTDRLVVTLDGPMAYWTKGNFAKIVLSVETEADLLTIHTTARRAGLPTAIITDARRTEFKGVPTRTAVAIGPAEIGEIDVITGVEGLVKTKLA